ncbi:LacI family DNA-binding transcriptional regulator [Gorillibacterium timonense]|uniref:LacI family DNA-binding transcriptional regulator n=1 Tax=Gorillibacterium timonense TaxID=1689269 RepID=UPI00071D2B54|nr:LacI family DNA-binding transcriptional regulator [Gorillibacterium timonense]
MVTIYDIAEKAKVSAMTVSRVINESGRISEKTRQRVKKVMEEMHYIPNHMARSLVLQQTNLLYLLITDITNPFYTTVARGAEDAARKSGFRLLFGNSDENLSKEADYIDTILASRADGVLVAPAGDASLPHLSLLRQHKVPFVLLDREVPGIDCDVVLGDSNEGGRALVDYLVSLGHQNIAFVNGSSTVSSARHRLQGYLEGLKQNGLPFRESYCMEASFGMINDLTDMEAWLSSIDPFPSAIIAGNNVLALETIRLLRGRGLSIPSDVSVCCFDDFGPFSEIDPFMTVIAQQAYEFGYQGAQLLLERIKNRDFSEPWSKIVLPTELKPGRSVAERVHES